MEFESNTELEEELGSPEVDRGSRIKEITDKSTACYYEPVLSGLVCEESCGGSVVSSGSQIADQRIKMDELNATNVLAEARPMKIIESTAVLNDLCTVLVEESKPVDEGVLSTVIQGVGQRRSSSASPKNTIKTFEEFNSNTSLSPNRTSKPAEVVVLADDPDLPPTEKANAVHEDSQLEAGSSDVSKFVSENFLRGRKGLLECPELRHPNCRLSEDELKTMSLTLKNRTLRYNFLYKTYYRGDDPDQTMKNTMAQDREIGLTETQQIDDQYIGRLSNEENAHTAEQFVRHPDCKRSLEELRRMSCRVVNRRMRRLFMFSTYSKGADPDAMMEELLSYDHSWQRFLDPLAPWEELKSMSKKLPTARLRSIFLRETGRGKNPELYMKTLLSKEEIQKLLSHQQGNVELQGNQSLTVDNSIDEHEDPHAGNSQRDLTDGNTCSKGLCSNDSVRKSQSSVASSTAAACTSSVKEEEALCSVILTKNQKRKRRKKLKLEEDQNENNNNGCRDHGLSHADARTKAICHRQEPALKKTYVKTQPKVLSFEANPQPRTGASLTDVGELCGSGMSYGQQPSANPEFLEAYSSCYIQYSDFLSSLKRSPKCRYSLDRLIHMAEEIPESYGIAKKFFILRCYQYGDDPDRWDRSQSAGRANSHFATDNAFARSGFKRLEPQPGPSAALADAIQNDLFRPHHRDPQSAFEVPLGSVPGPSRLKRKDFYDDPVIHKKSKSFVTSTDPMKPAGTQPKPVEDPSSSGNPLHLCVVPTAYPKELLTDEQMDAIEDSILKTILEIDDEHMRPSFEQSFRNRGRYEVICTNELSKMWLYKYAGRLYQPWPSASLKLIPAGLPKIQANAALPLSRNDDNGRILKFIARQNTGLNVDQWEVLDRSDDGEHTHLSLLVDEASAKTLKVCRFIHFKMGSTKMVILEDSQKGPRNFKHHGADVDVAPDQATHEKLH